MGEQEKEEGKGTETLPSFYLGGTSYFLQSQCFLAPCRITGLGKPGGWMEH